MKIVVLDGNALNPGDLDWSEIKSLGDFTLYPRTSPEDMIKRIGDAEIVITNKTFITAEIMDSCKNMKYIGVLATGYNTIDVKAAKERGIVVCNIPSYSTDSVAQFVFAHILNVFCDVSGHNEHVKDGGWTNCPDFCYWLHPLWELKGKTLGIIGYGQIGQAVAKIADAFGMKVLACAAHPKEGCCDIDTVFENSDIISLHCPLTADNANLINHKSINKMKDGVVIINTARGGLVCEADLADALNSGKVLAAGVDVLSSEPPKADNPLLSAKNCYITPHIAWAPRETRQRLMDIAVSSLKAFLEGHPINTVN